jgi:FMN phosphatase YigB (HAD superfamily)
MRIAIDIDSTLHHYWDLLEEVAQRRFGVAIPYAEQVVWEIDRLKPEQLNAAVRETHSEPQILGSEPYPGAVDTVKSWHEAGHFIHVTSHRSASAHDATARWLDEIGLPYDELYCSYDKLARAREIGIDVLVDDAPANLLGALDSGMTAATLLHPWNRTLCEEESVICAPDWPTLQQRLEPILAGGA